MKTELESQTILYGSFMTCNNDLSIGLMDYWLCQPSEQSFKVWFKAIFAKEYISIYNFYYFDDFIDGLPGMIAMHKYGIFRIIAPIPTKTDLIRLCDAADYNDFFPIEDHDEWLPIKEALIQRLENDPQPISQTVVELLKRNTELETDY